MTAKRISAAMVIALCAIAARVAVGLALRQDMWASIVAYWIVLTIKNIADWRSNR